MFKIERYISVQSFPFVITDWRRDVKKVKLTTKIKRTWNQRMNVRNDGMAIRSKIVLTRYRNVNHLLKNVIAE